MHLIETAYSNPMIEMITTQWVIVCGGEEEEEEAFVALFSREMTPFASHCELNRAWQGV